MQKKKRTQRDEQPDPAKKGVPKSFVWAAGSKRSLVRELCGDLRCLMQPHTAAKLKVSHRNVLKDFVHVAGPLGVTHFVVLTATDKASYLKLCKSPRVRLPASRLALAQTALSRGVCLPLITRSVCQLLAPPYDITPHGCNAAQQLCRDPLPCSRSWSTRTCATCWRRSGTLGGQMPPFCTRRSSCCRASRASST